MVTQLVQQRHTGIGSSLCVDVCAQAALGLKNPNQTTTQAGTGI